MPKKFIALRQKQVIFFIHQNVSYYNVLFSKNFGILLELKHVKKVSKF